MKRKIRKQGNGIVVGLPPEVMELLGVKEGDQIEFKATATGLCRIEKAKEFINKEM